MKPLRAYLLVRQEVGVWNVTVHRDFESLMDAWQPYVESPTLGAVVHIGFWRPDTDTFESVVAQYPGRMLITESARYALPQPCTVAARRACEIDGMPIYVALSGWGYETTAEQLGLGEVIPDINLCESGSAPDRQVRDIELKGMDLSVRLRNCLESVDIDTIVELAKRTERDLLSIKNFGRTSLLEAIDVLEGFGLSLGMNDTSIEVEKVIPGEGASNATNLADVIERALSLLTEQQEYVMRGRMGFGLARETLEKIGTELNITRERVRQIETQCIKKMSRIIIRENEIESRLERVLSNRTEALPLVGMEIIDPWFVGTDRLERPLEYVLDRFLSNRFSLVRFRKQAFISKITQGQWDEATRVAKKTLEANAGQSLSESEARSFVESHLVGSGEELRTELWEEVTQSAHFAKVSGEDEEKVLVSVGSGLEKVIEAVLMEADTPLHYSDISVLCEKKLGRNINPRYAHNAAHNVGLLFGRGTYGLIKHYPLSEVERRLLVAEVEDLIEGDAGRQWHAREIVDAIEYQVDFGERLTPYIVSIALEKSLNISYLGKMVWASNSAGASSYANRIDVHQAIVSLLREAGKPLRTDEVKARISRDRGLNSTFQIFPSGALVRVGRSHWGLMERDVPFTEAEVGALINQMEQVLRKRGKGLHVSEIQDALGSSFPPVYRVEDPALLLGLAQKSDQVATVKGQYICLPEWGESRRYTASESVRQVLISVGLTGITLDEGIKASEALLERPLARNTFANTCANFGATYSELTSRWTLNPEMDNNEE